MGAGAAPRRRRRRAHGHPRRDPDARRRAGRPGGGALAGRALPGPPARARHPGHGGVGRGASAATTSGPSSTCTTARATWSSRWRATARHEAVAADLEGRFAGAGWRRSAAAQRARARHGAARRGAPAHRAGPPGLRRPLGVALRRAALAPGRAQPRAGRRPLEPALPEGARGAGPGLLGLVGAGRLRRRRLAGRRRGHRTRARRRGAAHRDGELELLAQTGITRARAGRRQG